jgi:N-methyl-L-proline demethylase
MDSFWSPATNHRGDDWGGSLDNRLRFTWAVIDAVRAAVGPDFIVGIRMVADEDWDKGLSREEGVEIARASRPRASSTSSTSSAAISRQTRHWRM